MEHLGNAEWQKLNLGRLAVALGATSLVENLLYHPWWVLKTREQVELGTSSSSVWQNSYRLASNIWKKEGVKALYRGFWPGTLGSLPSGYVYLIVYHKTKHDLSQTNVSPTVRLAAPFLAGVVAEAASIGLFVPVDVITQRMQLQTTTGQNSYQVTTNLLKNEGIYGIYRGTSLTAFKLGIGSGVWWLSYERLKHYLNQKMSISPSSYFSSFSNGVLGVLPGFFAGTLSTIVTNPLDVVKTRIQTQVSVNTQGGMPYSGMMEGIKVIWRTEGWKGLNRGIIPKLISQGPLSAVWSLVYELVMKYSTVQEE